MKLSVDLVLLYEYIPIKAEILSQKLLERCVRFFTLTKSRTSSMRPQANGCVERFNRTLATMLTMYCEHDQKTWDKYLPQVMMAYRASVHSSIGKTPNLMMLHVSRNVTLPLEAVVGKPPHSTDDHDVERDEHIKRLQKTFRDVYDLARENLKKNRRLQKTLL